VFAVHPSKELLRSENNLPKANGARTAVCAAKLLEEAKLANIIGTSKLVADRLKFLHGLEALLFGTDAKPHLKERSQLHRIVADNTWIFGEEFSLTVDDQSLTEVLKKHRRLVGEETVIDAPVRRIDGKVGIVDLMLSRSVPQNRPDEFEHLVVELKRPIVTVGAEEIAQRIICKPMSILNGRCLTSNELTKSI
jgi:hypothetical protein